MRFRNQRSCSLFDLGKNTCHIHIFLTRTIYSCRERRNYVCFSLLPLLSLLASCLLCLLAACEVTGGLDKTPSEPHALRSLRSLQLAQGLSHVSGEGLAHGQWESINDEPFQ